MQYFDERPKIAKRKPHKRNDKKVVKKDHIKPIFEEFMEHKIKQNLRPASLNQYIGLIKNLNKFQEYRKGNQPLYLSDIDVQFIEDYVYYLKHEYVRYDGHQFIPDHAKKRGLKDVSIAGKLKYLSVFTRWCHKRGLIEKNPFDDYEGFKRDKEEIEILTREELNKLLKVGKSYSEKSFKHFRDYVFLHLLVNSMTRVTETMKISPSDINHTEREILIRAENAKGRRARIIPLSNQTYRLIVQLLEENEAFDGDVDDLLFLSLSGRILNKNNLLRDIRKWAIEAGIEKHFTLHLIRHSTATLYLAEGGDIETLRAILGHADYRMIQTYVHLASSHVSAKHSKYSFFGTENVITRKRSNKRKN